MGFLFFCFKFTIFVLENVTFFFQLIRLSLCSSKNVPGIIKPLNISFSITLYGIFLCICLFTYLFLLHLLFIYPYSSILILIFVLFIYLFFSYFSSIYLLYFTFFFVRVNTYLLPCSLWLPHYHSLSW